jgi:hypothetical protein
VLLYINRIAHPSVPKCINLTHLSHSSTAAAEYASSPSADPEPTAAEKGCQCPYPCLRGGRRSSQRSIVGRGSLGSGWRHSICTLRHLTLIVDGEVTLGFSWVGIGVFLGRDSGSLEWDWGFVRSGINQYLSWENQKKSRNYAQLALIRSCLRAWLSLHAFSIFRYENVHCVIHMVYTHTRNGVSYSVFR